MNNSVEGNESSKEFSNKFPEEYEQYLENIELEKYVFRLYIAGNSLKSVRAIQNLKKICEEHLQGNYELEVVDIYQQPYLLEQEQIFAIPTLIKKLPLPLQRLVGDMTNTEKVLVCLGL